MNWKNIPLAHKVATIVAGITVVVWMIFNFQPELLPVNLTYPSIAVFTVCEAIIYWNSKRKWAYLLIAGAVISMVFFTLELFL